MERRNLKEFVLEEVYKSTSSSINKRFIDPN